MAKEGIAKLASRAKFSDFFAGSIFCKVTYPVGHRHFAKNRIQRKKRKFGSEWQFAIPSKVRLHRLHSLYTLDEMHEEALIPQFNEPFRSVLIFGPPGSGKGTLGKFLSSAGNHFHLSSGDVFRGLSPESPAGKLYHNYAGKGLLLPDEVTIQIWHHFVHGLIATNRYFPSQQLLLLDGIPRTIRQADLLQRYIHIERIIVLEISNDEELIKRIQRRALLEKRSDDLDSRVLKTRMEVYEQDTVKLLKHYPQEILSRFNAARKPLEILRDVLVNLSDLFS